MAGSKKNFKKKEEIQQLKENKKIEIQKIFQQLELDKKNKSLIMNNEKSENYVKPDEGPQKLTSEQIEFLGEYYNEMNYGEFVLVFQNPDHPSASDKGITYEEATNIYQNQLSQELFNKNFTQTDYQIEQENFLEKFKKLQPFQKNEKKKQWAKGGYMCYNDEKKTWICNNDVANDFLTLCRFTIMSKLKNQGKFLQRCFVSQDGTKILLVLIITGNQVHEMAEEFKIPKEMELGYCDLFSLEPVDDKNRPLRFHSRIRQAMQKKDHGILQNDYEDFYIKGIGNDYQNFNKRLTKLDDQQFDYELVQRQQEIDKIYAYLNKELKLDILLGRDHDIIDEAIGEYIQNANYQNFILQVSRNVWNTYVLFMEYFIKVFDFLEKDKLKCERDDDIKSALNYYPFIYKLTFMYAMGEANKYKKIPNHKLKNLWDNLELIPTAPYLTYQATSKQNINCKFNNNSYADLFWRTCQINEIGDRQVFNQMEKLKVINAIFSQLFNVLQLKKSQILEDMIPLHDYFLLENQSSVQLFTPLKEMGVFKERKLKDDRAKHVLEKYFRNLSEYADSVDFQIDDMSLNQKTKFIWWKPWQMDIVSIRNYYGEKIAIYFLFLQSYTFCMLPMAIFGLIIHQFDEQFQFESQLIQSLIISIWSIYVIEKFQGDQYVFSIKFGQTDMKNSQVIRPDFDGQFTRNLTDDNLNDQYFDKHQKMMLIIKSYSISFLIICAAILVVFGIFTLKSNLLDDHSVSPDVKNYLPSLLNFVQIAFFNWFYESVAQKSNFNENHKYVSEYENGLILKMFIFKAINSFQSFFIIAFLSSWFPKLDICRVQNYDGTIEENCFKQLNLQMSSIFTAQLTSSIPEIGVPFIMYYLKSKKLKPADLKNPFSLIDDQIERQLNLESYKYNDEVDGGFNDYLPLVIQFSYLSLFGVAYPLAFFLALLYLVAQLQIDITKLNRLSKRPIPQGACDIGIWLHILLVMSYLGAFVNIAILCFTLKFKFTYKAYTVFYILITIMFLVKSLFKYIFPRIPQRAIILNQRLQAIKTKFFKLQTKQQKIEPCIQEFKIDNLLVKQEVENLVPGFFDIEEQIVESKIETIGVDHNGQVLQTPDQQEIDNFNMEEEQNQLNNEDQNL